jgi:hypothetical protein
MSARLPEQLGFAALLQSADTDNAARRTQRETAHLPAGMAEGIVHFRQLLEVHHAAMIAADVKTTMRLREEAHLLARKLNGGNSGIIADDTSAGCVLERETAAKPGDIPLWGQCGSFTITRSAMQVRIEFDGVFGIGAAFGFWPGFSAHAVDRSAPFLSETGYRSFLGVHAAPAANLTPDAFVAMVIDDYVRRHLKGRLLTIKECRAGDG